MAMPGLDRSRFIRILKLTDSSNDSEALSAVRRANALMHAAGLSWDRLIVLLPLPADMEPPASKDREDPLWADASMFSQERWPFAPMMPLAMRNTEGQVHARLRSAALWLRQALFPAWTAAAAFLAGCIERAQLRKVGGPSTTIRLPTPKEALLRLAERGARLVPWERFKRRLRLVPIKKQDR
jgi:hypothetical protein